MVDRAKPVFALTSGKRSRRWVLEYVIVKTSFAVISAAKVIHLRLNYIKTRNGKVGNFFPMASIHSIASHLIKFMDIF